MKHLFSISGYDKIGIDKDLNVYSFYTGKMKLVTTRKDRDGYTRLTIRNNKGERRTVGLHRIVHIAMKGDIPKDLQIDHLDMNKDNNYPENLEVVTNRENARRRTGKVFSKDRKVNYKVYKYYMIQFKNGRSINSISIEMKISYKTCYCMLKGVHYQNFFNKFQEETLMNRSPIKE